ncbi:MAG: ABC transporter ATP-binding protein [Bacteroidota bacterium]
MKILEVQQLSKSYDGKSYALADCSFSLDAGSICAVVGESGSGKSTLLRLIAGLERPNNGTIKIKDALMSSDSIIVPPQKRGVGMVFQDFALFPHLTVAQNVAYGLKTNKKEKVESLLRMIKMEHYAQRYPGELSGGEQQRVALVRTLALEPGLLLLDEPFSNLDTNLKTALRQEVRQIVKDMQLSMVFITHDIFDALDIADEIIFLNKGTIIHQGPIEKIFQAVKQDYIQQSFQDLKTSAQRILAMMQPK